MSFVDDLTIDDIKNKPIPIKALLENSLYYPACRYDGGMVKFTDFQSFIYCDYGVAKEGLLEELNTFGNCKLLGYRDVTPEELIPAGFDQLAKFGISAVKNQAEASNNRIYGHRGLDKDSFGIWALYDGPKRFSLLYLNADGVATYQALYWSNKTTAQAVAIIKADAFTNNWTRFNGGGPLAQVVLGNPYGTPEFIYYGGYPEGAGNNLSWRDYQLTDIIRHYYGDGSDSSVGCYRR